MPWQFSQYDLDYIKEYPEQAAIMRSQAASKVASLVAEMNSIGIVHTIDSLIVIGITGDEVPFGFYEEAFLAHCEGNYPYRFIHNADNVGVYEDYRCFVVNLPRKTELEGRVFAMYIFGCNSPTHMSEGCYFFFEAEADAIAMRLAL